MKFLVVILMCLMFIPATHAASCVRGVCSHELNSSMCGEKAVGHTCEQDNSCNATCGCFDSNKTFWYNVGCVCKSGTYGGVSCTTCPSGGTSNAGNNSAITDCYKVSNVSSASAHGTIKQTCRYSSSTSSYSICSTTSLVDCDAGYYRVNTSDLSCTAVGTNRYSPAGSFTSTLCPTYTNPSGGTSYGQTTGSGTGADAITDCKIPETEKFTDSTGSWVYSGGCAYSN